MHNMEAQALHMMWFAVPNDLIGGWCVTNVQLPPSQHAPDSQHWTIGDFLSQGVADHVANLHNLWLCQGRPEIEGAWDSSTD